MEQNKEQKPALPALPVVGQACKSENKPASMLKDLAKLMSSRRLARQRKTDLWEEVIEKPC